MINTEGTKVWAHRGASGYAPENTLEAFKNCLLYTSPSPRD